MNSPNVGSNLAPMISHQLRTLRSWLAEAGYAEVLVPHLRSSYSIGYPPTFKVTAPDNGSWTGSLSVTSSAYLALAARSIGNVYALSPSFRAEAAGFAEFNYLQLMNDRSFDALLDEAETLLRHITAQIDEALGRTTRLISTEPFPRITYHDAIQRVRGTVGDDLSFSSQKVLAEEIFASPVFITHFPRTVQPQNAVLRTDPSDNLLSFDLILPLAGETITGGEVETDRSQLLTNTSTFTPDLEAINAYADAVEALSAPRGYVGIGFERLTQFLLQTPTIEDAALFPVTLNNLFENAVLLRMINAHH